MIWKAQISILFLHLSNITDALKHFYMTFGERILTLRKKNKWSQAQLAKLIGTSAPIVGRYERNEIKPSIETAKNIADAFDEVTVDYLIGGMDNMILDKHLIQKMQDIQKLNDTDKGHIFALMDAFLQKTKMQRILQ